MNILLKSISVYQTYASIGKDCKLSYPFKSEDQIHTFGEFDIVDDEAWSVHRLGGEYFAVKNGQQVILRDRSTDVHWVELPDYRAKFQVFCNDKKVFEKLYIRPSLVDPWSEKGDWDIFFRIKEVNEKRGRYDNPLTGKFN